MGEGPYIVVHDGFQGPPKFEGFMEGADRLILDQHPVSIGATNVIMAHTVVQYIAFQNDHTSSCVLSTGSFGSSLTPFSQYADPRG